jgi:hypothetical protein
MGVLLAIAFLVVSVWAICQGNEEGSESLITFAFFALLAAIGFGISTLA